jgi:mannose-1-phosphate guanylyltransferase
MRDVSITILAGGSGTRLWPLSRRQHPKQLLALGGERSLLQSTVDRVLPLVPPERIYILTGPDLAASIAAQLPNIPPQNILIEPSPRGTAPCLGLAAMQLRRAHGGEGVMISLHADHIVRREEDFRATLLAAMATARQDYIVTIGIQPDHPNTGFGYIERSEALGREQGLDVYHVAGFTEKPPLERAREYVASGRFYWNTGYFTWTLDHILGEFRRLQPVLYAQLEQIVDAAGTPKAERIWSQIVPVTIDVGIMEHAARVAVVPCDLGWNDVGSWASLWDILPRDGEGNVALGDGQHVGLQTHNTLVYSSGRLVATVGLDDMLVIDTGDAVLVLPRSRAQDVSALVKELRARGLDRHL